MQVESLVPLGYRGCSHQFTVFREKLRQSGIGFLECFAIGRGGQTQAHSHADLVGGSVPALLRGRCARFKLHRTVHIQSGAHLADMLVLARLHALRQCRWEWRQFDFGHGKGILRSPGLHLHFLLFRLRRDNYRSRRLSRVLRLWGWLHLLALLFLLGRLIICLESLDQLGRIRRIQGTCTQQQHEQQAHPEPGKQLYLMFAVKQGFHEKSFIVRSLPPPCGDASP